jgi:hypothetical protein
MPVVWFIYPEVAGKSLEEINLLFASNSILASQNVKEYHRMLDAAGGNLAVASRRLLDSVDEQFPDVGMRRGSSAVDPEGKTHQHVEVSDHDSMEKTIH